MAVETFDLECLLAVERLGGVTRAAEAIGISQPAMTKVVRRLEALAGTALFERSGRGIVPTLAGQALLRRAQVIVNETADALAEAAAIKRGDLGLVRIGYSATVPDGFVFGACQRLLNRWPNVRIKLSHQLGGSLIDALLGGELDLVVGPAPGTQFEAKLTVSTLYRDRLIIYSDSAHPLQQRSELRLTDLAEQAWLLPAPGFPLRQALERAFKEAGLPALQVHIEADFVSPALAEFVRATSLLCVGGTRIADALTWMRPLRLAHAELDLERPICATVRRGAWISPHVRELIRSMQDAAASR